MWQEQMVAQILKKSRVQVLLDGHGTCLWSNALLGGFPCQSHCMVRQSHHSIHCPSLVWHHTFCVCECVLHYDSCHFVLFAYSHAHARSLPSLLAYSLARSHPLSLTANLSCDCPVCISACVVSQLSSCRPTPLTAAADAALAPTPACCCPVPRGTMPGVAADEEDGPRAVLLLA